MVYTVGSSWANRTAESRSAGTKIQHSYTLSVHPAEFPLRRRRDWLSENKLTCLSAVGTTSAWSRPVLIHVDDSLRHLKDTFKCFTPEKEETGEVMKRNNKLNWTEGHSTRGEAALLSPPCFLLQIHHTHMLHHTNWTHYVLLYFIQTKICFTPPLRWLFLPCYIFYLIFKIFLSVAQTGDNNLCSCVWWGRGCHGNCSTTGGRMNELSLSNEPPPAETKISQLSRTFMLRWLESITEFEPSRQDRMLSSNVITWTEHVVFTSRSEGSVFLRSPADVSICLFQNRTLSQAMMFPDLSWTLNLNKCECAACSVVTDGICSLVSLAETCAAHICSGDGQTDQSMDLLWWVNCPHRVGWYRTNGLDQSSWCILYIILYMKLSSITALTECNMFWGWCVRGRSGGSSQGCVSGKHVICCSKILWLMKNTTCEYLKHLINTQNNRASDRHTAVEMWWGSEDACCWVSYSPVAGVSFGFPLLNKFCVTI